MLPSFEQLLCDRLGALQRALHTQESPIVRLDTPFLIHPDEPPVMYMPDLGMIPPAMQSHPELQRVGTGQDMFTLTTRDLDTRMCQQIPAEEVEATLAVFQICAVPVWEKVQIRQLWEAERAGMIDLYPVLFLSHEEIRGCIPEMSKSIFARVLPNQENLRTGLEIGQRSDLLDDIATLNPGANKGHIDRGAGVVLQRRAETLAVVTVASAILVWKEGGEERASRFLKDCSQVSNQKRKLDHL